MATRDDADDVVHVEVGEVEYGAPDAPPLGLAAVPQRFVSGGPRLDPGWLLGTRPAGSGGGGAGGGPVGCHGGWGYGSNACVHGRLGHFGRVASRDRRRLSPMLPLVVAVPSPLPTQLSTPPLSRPIARPNPCIEHAPHRIIHSFGTQTQSASFCPSAQQISLRTPLCRCATRQVAQGQEGRPRFSLRAQSPGERRLATFSFCRITGPVENHCLR